MKRTLAIETSCDDTSLAIVEEDKGYFSVLKMLTTSQTTLHDAYGGVVPELAYRAHADAILPLVEELGGTDLKEQIESITVTARPGLPGGLLVGINAAHTLGLLREKPVIEVNHIMGHVFSLLLERQLDITNTPYICLTVSGGHSDIYLVETQGHEQEKKEITSEHDWIKRQHLGIGEECVVGPFHITKIGQTRDDAAGEVFDKVARMLGGPYPGGKWLSDLAASGGPDDRISFRASRLELGTFDMSFSGLKSQVYNLLRSFEQSGIVVDEMVKANIARGFQEIITDMLVEKICAAVDVYGARVVGLVGGVSANIRLREKMKAALATSNQSSTIPLYTPTKFVYCTDNAAMIGVVGLL